MKLIGSRLEKQIREGLIHSNYRLFNDAECNYLYKALLKIYPKLKTAYILDYIPEQGEDIYTLIIDNKDIIEIELDRIDTSKEPIYEIFHLHQYRKNLRGKDRNLTLIIALELIEQDPLDGRIKYSNIAIKERLEKQLNQDHPNAKDGAIFEESIESLEIVRFLARHIKKYTGSSLIIDYGYDIATKSRQRGQYNSTLQAIKNHQYHSVIDSMGEADLTAHVDFQALKKAARQQGIKEYDIYSQAGFLQKYGIILRYQNLQKKLPADEKQILAKQLYRLTDKTQMGELFKALIISHAQNKLLT